MENVRKQSVLSSSGVGSPLHDQDVDMSPSFSKKFSGMGTAATALKGKVARAGFSRT